jgi:hypothetical protein
MFSLADGRAAVKDSRALTAGEFYKREICGFRSPVTHVSLGLTYRNYDKAIA